MNDFVPYFAGLITIMFGAGFFLALKEARKDKY
jgi:hypothetical protein